MELIGLIYKYVTMTKMLLLEGCRRTMSFIVKSRDWTVLNLSEMITRIQSTVGQTSIFHLRCLHAAVRSADTERTQVNIRSSKMDYRSAKVLLAVSFISYVKEELKQLNSMISGFPCWC